MVANGSTVDAFEPVTKLESEASDAPPTFLGKANARQRERMGETSKRSHFGIHAEHQAKLSTIHGRLGYCVGLTFVHDMTRATIG